MSTIPNIQQFIETESEVVKLLLSILLGAIIGWQRSRTGHSAGIRTFTMICMGSCLFGIISYVVPQPGDPSRIAAQVVPGIGFIGIGIIMRDGANVKGLTTAATLWSVAAIGLAVSYDLYMLACMATMFTLFFLSANHMGFWRYITQQRPEDQLIKTADDHQVKSNDPKT